jgi:hypothetical protein
MRNDTRPDVEAELRRLKDFQRRTVDLVHRRLWLDEDQTKRFLVADEVGLGKTLVARGVIARTIDHLWDDVDRIDIVYICSNSQIAAQNLGRLNIGGYEVSHADRLTLLPREIRNLRDKKVNFVSFTPGTSFTISESGGKSEERVVLQHLVAASLGDDVLHLAGWQKFFCGGMRRDRYVRFLKDYDRTSIDHVIADRFARDLTEATFDRAPLIDVLKETAAGFKWLRGKPDWPLSRRRYRLIGRMRKLVAEAAVEALEPDLVILDEFQRFKDLMDPRQPGADLAHAIFDQTTSRVLLLSATPYKMYTLPDEPEGDDHYRDFHATVSFLAGPAEADAVGADLRVMRETALASGDPVVGRRACERVTARLSRVICRTERLAATTDRDGMLVESSLPDAVPTADDIRALRTFHRVAHAMGQPDVLEYWRSSPYLFNLMDGYQLKDRLKATLEKDGSRVRPHLTDGSGLLRWDDVRSYAEVDPGNPKMRGLMENVMDRGAWRVAWLPPSLPYYSPGGPFASAELQCFTKRLVFSAWAVVPKAISVILSYEA